MYVVRIAYEESVHRERERFWNVMCDVYVKRRERKRRVAIGKLR